jgi:hypothetical protein
MSFEDYLVVTNLGDGKGMIGTGGTDDSNAIKKELTSDELEISEKMSSLTITKIGSFAFRYCSIIRKVKLPNTLTVIGYKAFDICVNLCDINLPDSLASIGENAFAVCAIKEFIIPLSLSKIGSSAFCANSVLKKFVVSDEHEYFSTDFQHILYDKNKTEIICVPNIETVHIPSCVNIARYRSLDSCNIKNLYIYGSGKNWVKRTVSSSKIRNLYYYGKEEPIHEINFQSTIHVVRVLKWYQGDKFCNVSVSLFSERTCRSFQTKTDLKYQIVVLILNRHLDNK